MPRRSLYQVASAAFLVLITAGATMLAQGVLAQLGLTEASATQHVLKTLQAVTIPSSEALPAARKAFEKLPPAARGPAATALYAWTKTYVNSPAFKTDYARIRKEATPQPIQYDGTIDEEIKTEVDAQIKQQEDGMKQVLAMLPPEERPKMEAQMKQNIAMFRSPEYQGGLRADKEQARAKDKQDYEMLMGQWRENFPVDPNVIVAKHLREFLNATADVDYAAKGSMKPGESGMFFAFDNPAYNEKPWQWVEAFTVGKEATTAARAAAEAWLKELPAK